MVENEFVRGASDSCVDIYQQAVDAVGLWASERDVFSRYFKFQDHILDMGCGAGRVSFGLVASGYSHVVGIDFSREMVQAAIEHNTAHKDQLSFIEGDFLNLDIQDEAFDSAVFSFNGLMQIPGFQQRVQALSELVRVIKPGGVIIFTTQDRDADPLFFEFWRDEREMWRNENQDPQLHEFGDIFFSEEDGTKSFIHIPDVNEVMQMITAVNVHLIETFPRSARFNENETVTAFSSDCRFWVIRKPNRL